MEIDQLGQVEKTDYSILKSAGPCDSPLEDRVSRNSWE